MYRHLFSFTLPVELDNRYAWALMLGGVTARSRLGLKQHHWCTCWCFARRRRPNGWWSNGFARDKLRVNRALWAKALALDLETDAVDLDASPSAALACFLSSSDRGGPLAVSPHCICYLWLVLKKDATLRSPATLLALGLALALPLDLVGTWLDHEFSRLCVNFHRTTGSRRNWDFRSRARRWGDCETLRI